MKIEIEAELHSEKVHILVGGRLVAVVDARGDYYRTPRELRIASSVAAWFEQMEHIRQREVPSDA
jgi:hypothetical protein